MNGENIDFVGKYETIYFSDDGSIRIRFSGETTNIGEKVKADMSLCLKNNYKRNKFLEKLDIWGFAHHYDTSFDKYRNEIDEEIFYIDIYSDISLYEKIINKIDKNLHINITIKKIDGETFKRIDELYHKETKDKVKKDDILDDIAWDNQENGPDYEDNAKKFMPITFYNLVHSLQEDNDKQPNEDLVTEKQSSNEEYALMELKEELRKDRIGFLIILLIIVVGSLIFGTKIDLYLALIVLALFCILERNTLMYKLLRIKNIFKE